MAAYSGPRPDRTSLIVHLDAANEKSYSGSGSTWNDLTNENNDATIVTAPTYTSNNIHTFDFDGVDDIMTLSPITIPTTLTYEFWINIDSYNGNNTGGYQTLISRGEQDYRLYINYVSGQGQLITRFNGLTDLIQQTPYLDTNTWYCVVATKSTSGFSLYVNGELNASDLQTANPSNTSNGFSIGGWSTTNLARQVDGEIACFRVYDRTLTAAEVKRNFNAQRGRFGT